jgi:3-oxoacyl-[acyl-carrier-protein] synthase-3
MAYLKSFGSALPERVVTNDELAARIGCEAAWILQMSGIVERRWAAADESVVDLAVRAGEDTIARAGADRGQIKLVLVSSGSSERRFPGPAAETAHRLRLGDTPAIDLPLASAGSLVALGLASRLAESVGDVLVIGAEKMSAVIDREPLDRNTAILFGDGAGAAWVSRDDGALQVDRFRAAHRWIVRGVVTPRIRREHLDGRTHGNPASLAQNACRDPGSAGAQRSQGRRGRRVPAASGQSQPDDARRSGRRRPVERFVSNVERYGNTSSASMLIAAAEWSADAKVSANELVVFAAFGAGFQWGALLAAGAT